MFLRTFRALRVIPRVAVGIRVPYAVPRDAALRCLSSRSTPWVPPAGRLSGRCKCGSVGYEATGPSALNIVCHCSICRAATGAQSTAAACFKPEQVRLVNPEGMRTSKPSGSQNTRFYCASCGSYVCEDATGPLGVFALPLSAAVGDVSESYLPNHHVFYANRLADVADELPKWETLPQGKLLPDTSGPEAKGTSGPTHAAPMVARDVATGRIRKDVVSMSPIRPPYPRAYRFTETDPVVNHVTRVSPEKVKERVAAKYEPSPGAFVAPAETKRDVIVIGGGHNGLVSAAYLAKAGLNVLVLERRHIVGGAAVTEEIVPGFKFSRASYVAGLVRPAVMSDLGLERYGFKYLPRNPSSFTPSKLDGPLYGKSLFFWDDMKKTQASIAQFSEKDAETYPMYEEFLSKAREVVQPLLDHPPPDPRQGKWRERMDTMRAMREVASVGMKNRDVLVPLYELFTGPAAQLLDRWFDSEILKTTLATDAVIGSLASPTQIGSAYVLLHHVMGEAAGKKGVWSFVEGGMGALSEAIAAAARGFGAEIAVNATVSDILFDGDRVRGVRMADGTKLHADLVLAGCTPYHAFLELLPGLSRDSGNKDEASPLPADFQHHVRHTDYSCGAFKINLALDALPNFACLPNDPSGLPGPQHRGTIHFETIMQEIDNAYREASLGIPATRPVIEMTIPSAVDPSVAPPGKHVAQFFVQYAPYDVDPKIGNWADESFKAAFVERVIGIVDEFCPGFSSSIIGRDVLSPLDLERIFGLHKGNIFHGSLALHQLGYTRPAFGYSSHRTPLKGLYVCGSGAHPGGGVMGAPGRNCARVVLSDLGKS